MWHPRFDVTYSVRVDGYSRTIWAILAACLLLRTLLRDFTRPALARRGGGLHYVVVVHRGSGRADADPLPVRPLLIGAFSLAATPHAEKE